MGPCSSELENGYEWTVQDKYFKCPIGIKNVFYAHPTKKDNYKKPVDRYGKFDFMFHISSIIDKYFK